MFVLKAFLKSLFSFASFHFHGPLTGPVFFFSFGLMKAPFEGLMKFVFFSPVLKTLQLQLTLFFGKAPSTRLALVCVFPTNRQRGVLLDLCLLFFWGFSEAG